MRLALVLLVFLSASFFSQAKGDDNLGISQEENAALLLPNNDVTLPENLIKAGEAGDSGIVDVLVEEEPTSLMQPPEEQPQQQPEEQPQQQPEEQPQQQPEEQPQQQPEEQSQQQSEEQQSEEQSQQQPEEQPQQPPEEQPQQQSDDVDNFDVFPEIVEETFGRAEEAGPEDLLKKELDLEEQILDGIVLKEEAKEELRALLEEWQAEEGKREVEAEDEPKGSEDWYEEP